MSEWVNDWVNDSFVIYCHRKRLAIVILFTFVSFCRRFLVCQQLLPMPNERSLLKKNKALISLGRWKWSYRTIDGNGKEERQGTNKWKETMDKGTKQKCMHGRKESFQFSRGLPDLATSLTFLPSVWARYPRMEKMANPANMLVKASNPTTNNASLSELKHSQNN